MKRILNLIEKYVKKSFLLSNEYAKEYKSKEVCRRIYINGNSFMEYQIDLVFLISTRAWFDKTIRFNIKMNTHDNRIYIKKGYGDMYEIYDRKDFDKVINYIDEEVYEFALKENDQNKNNLKIKRIV